MSNPAQYQESRAFYRKNFTSLLLALIQSKSIDVASRLDEIQKHVAQNEA